MKITLLALGSLFFCACASTCPRAGSVADAAALRPEDERDRADRLRLEEARRDGAALEAREKAEQAQQEHWLLNGVIRAGGAALSAQ